MIVGVNAYVESTRSRRSTSTGPTPRSSARQIERLHELARPARPGARTRPRMAALHAACAGTDNVMPHLVEAADAGATLGEMCDVFREVWGAVPRSRPAGRSTR